MVDFKKALEAKQKFYDMERDGITQSLMSMFLTCREKARLYCEGWDSKYSSPSLTYGSVGHSGLELAYLDIKSGKLKGAPSIGQARRYVDETEKRWKLENPKPNNEALQYLEESLALIEQTIPRYFDFWKEDFKKKEWVSLEEKFRVNTDIKVKGKTITIPVNGKKDGLFKSAKGLWLFETKFKSMISEGDIVETLSFETQIMLYMWSVMKEKGITPKGALYNIIRRTSLRQKVGESLVKYAQRIGKDIDSRPDFYFMRMESATTEEELKAFEVDFSRIVKDMYKWHIGLVGHYKNTYSCIGKYGRCQYLPTCSRGDKSGLVKRKTMFKELQDL